jgi:hypothetical protein
VDWKAVANDDAAWSSELTMSSVTTSFGLLSTHVLTLVRYASSVPPFSSEHLFDAKNGSQS